MADNLYKAIPLHWKTSSARVRILSLLRHDSNTLSTDHIGFYFYTQNAKNWTCRSLLDWANELGVTRERVRQLMAHLQRKHYIERTKIAGEKRYCIRLLERETL